MCLKPLVRFLFSFLSCRSRWDFATWKLLRLRTRAISDCQRLRFQSRHCNWRDVVVVVFFPCKLVRRALLFFSSSPGSTTTLQSSNLRLASGAGFCVSRWGKNPSGSLSLMGCPVEKIRRWRSWERLFSFRTRRVREQMQLGHGGLRDNSRARGGKIILPPVHGKKKTSGPLTPPSFETKRYSSGEERFV